MEGGGYSKNIWREKETLNSRTRRERQRSEEDWERWFIRRLREVGWDYRNDLKNKENQTSETKLESHLLRQIRRLYIQKNNLEDSFEFTRREKIQLLQELSSFKSRDISKPIELTISSKRNVKKLQIPLIDSENIENNTFWVAQQVKEHNPRFTHIYDLVLLINGIPLVCIELKKATISANEALNQLKNYEKERQEAKCLSIFNNFQLFVALNFQRFYCMKREEIVKVNIGELGDRGGNYVYLVWLEKQIKDYFSPSWIFKKILQKKPIYRRVYRTERTLVQKKVHNYKTKRDTAISLSDEDTGQIRISKRRLEIIYIDFLAGIALIAFFLLINFLSGWVWWTVLIGLITIGIVLYKRVSREYTDW